MLAKAKAEEDHERTTPAWKEWRRAAKGEFDSDLMHFDKQVQEGRKLQGRTDFTDFTGADDPEQVQMWENFAEQAQRLGIMAERHAQMAVEAKREGRVHEVEACALRAVACNQALLKLKDFIKNQILDPGHKLMRTNINNEYWPEKPPGRARGEGD